MILFAHTKFGLVRIQGSRVKRGAESAPRSERVFQIPVQIGLNNLLSLPNMLEALLKNFLLCDLMTVFARFPKYWLNLLRYSTLKSPSFML